MKLYRALQAQGVDVLLDDREERVGVKFKDMELIGIPVQVVVGKGLANGTVEVGLRREPGGRIETAVTEAAATVLRLVTAGRNFVPGIAVV